MVWNILHIQNRWKWIFFFGIALYLVLNQIIIGLRADHVLIAGIALGMTIRWKKARQFFTDWWPLFFFWISYDWMRGITGIIHRVVNVIPPYTLELSLFGPLFGGQIPNFFFEYFQVCHLDAPGKIILDVMGAIFYILHFWAPLILGWIIWHVRSDRPLFYRFIYTLGIVSIMGIVTFILYPAAPPWYVYKYGFMQPTGMIEGSAAGLANFDQLLGIRLIQNFWDSYNANLFAAIPSLHAAHSFLMAFFGMRTFHRFRPVWLIYPIGTCFSAVYLNEHYIIDLLIGLIYFVIAYQLVARLVYPGILKKVVETGNRLYPNLWRTMR